MIVAAYIEQLSGALAPASVKQHLAALRMLFDWLVVGQSARTAADRSSGAASPGGAMRCKIGRCRA